MNRFNNNNNKSNNFNNNQIISNYRNFAQSNAQFQNNALLANNPFFQNPDQLKRMQMDKMQQQSSKLKQLQGLKQAQRYNDIDKYYGKDKITESVIKPMKMERGMDPKIKNDLVELEQNYILQEFKQGKNEVVIKVPVVWTQLWKNRTNIPYKNVLKNQDYNRLIKTESDLLVHKVTPADKLGIDKDLDKLKKNIETHDNELKTIYTTSKELECKKNFEYNNKYKFRIYKTSKDFNDMKQDKIEFYKQEQKNQEKEKKQVDEIRESLISNGIFKDEDVKEIDSDKNEEAITKQIEDKLKDTLGDDYNKTSEPKVNTDKINKNSTAKVNTDKTNKNSEVENIKDKYKNRTKKIEKEDDTENLKDKYLKRQKK